MAWAWHGKCELAWAWHGKCDLAWAWHGKCESYTAALFIRWERHILNP